MDIEHTQTIITEYDRLYPTFQQIVGLKSPN